MACMLEPCCVDKQCGQPSQQVSPSRLQTQPSSQAPEMCVLRSAKGRSLSTDRTHCCRLLSRQHHRGASMHGTEVVVDLHIRASCCVVAAPVLTLRLLCCSAAVEHSCGRVRRSCGGKRWQTAGERTLSCACVVSLEMVQQLASAGGGSAHTRKQHSSVELLILVRQLVVLQSCGRLSSRTFTPLMCLPGKIT